MTSIIVLSTGTSATCLGAFLAAVFGSRFFLAVGFVALGPARRILDFAFCGVARFTAFLLAGLALALPRCELFLRVETRFFALAMAVSCEVCRRHANPEALNHAAIIFQRFATRFHGCGRDRKTASAPELAPGISVVGDK
jgi:hypothetical protein